MLDLLKAIAPNGDVPALVSDLINHRAQTDHYGNDVSLIHLPPLEIGFRMVHHTKPGSPLQKATIYAGRGKFVRYSAYSSDNPCSAEWIKVGGYEAEWGDGDLLAVRQNPKGAAIPEADVRDINGNFSAFMLLALSAVHAADLWEVREVAAPAQPEPGRRPTSADISILARHFNR